MEYTIRRTLAPVLLAFAVLVVAPARPVLALTASELRQDAEAALAHLYKETPSAKLLGDQAKAVLIFPNIVKAGFIVGGQFGEGVL